MSQAEIYSFLKRNKGKWYTSVDIVKRLYISQGSVSKALWGLRKTDFVKYKKVKHYKTHHVIYYYSV